MLVQGLGSVKSPRGSPSRRGATLLLADVDADRATALADTLGAKVVRADDVIGTQVRRRPPACAGRSSTRTIPLLRCRAIAGANNQLATPEDGDRLRDAGILFAPDFVVNAGGVMSSRAARRSSGTTPRPFRGSRRCGDSSGRSSTERIERASRRPPQRIGRGTRAGRGRARRVSAPRSARSRRKTPTPVMRSIAGLPYHFGQEQGRRDCAAAVRRDPGLVAVEGGEVVGFLTYVLRFDEAAEITWMAVQPIDDAWASGTS